MCNVHMYMYMYTVLKCGISRLLLCSPSFPPSLSSSLTPSLPPSLPQHGEKMDEEEVQQIIDEADLNGDGKLDYAEFCRMLLNTADACTRRSHQRAQQQLLQYNPAAITGLTGLGPIRTGFGAGQASYTGFVVRNTPPLAYRVAEAQLVPQAGKLKPKPNQSQRRERREKQRDNRTTSRSEVPPEFQSSDPAKAPQHTETSPRSQSRDPEKAPPPSKPRNPEKAPPPPPLSQASRESAPPTDGSDKRMSHTPSYSSTLSHPHAPPHTHTPPHPHTLMSHTPPHSSTLSHPHTPPHSHTHTTPLHSRELCHDGGGRADGGGFPQPPRHDGRGRGGRGGGGVGGVGGTWL